jgi:hypothetical protein
MLSDWIFADFSNFVEREGDGEEEAGRWFGRRRRGEREMEAGKGGKWQQ